LAPKLLGLHMDSSDSAEKAKIKLIADTLTEKLYTYDYIISKKEAKEIGLKISDPANNEEKLMWDLYSQYENELKLIEPFSPSQILHAGQTVVPFEEDCAYLEIINKTFALITAGDIYAPPTMEQLINMIPPLGWWPPWLVTTIANIMPQIVQLKQQINMLDPVVKIKSQKWSERK
jgi:hypothetical protein